MSEQNPEGYTNNNTYGRDSSRGEPSQESRYQGGFRANTTGANASYGARSYGNAESQTGNSFNQGAYYQGAQPPYGAGAYNGQSYGGYNTPNKPPKKKRTFLTVMCIILAVFAVAGLSIGAYTLFTSGKPAPAEQAANVPAPSEKPEDAPKTEEPVKPSEEPVKDDGTVITNEQAYIKQGEGELTPKEVSKKLIPSVVCIQKYQTVYPSERDLFSFGFGFGDYFGHGNENMQGELQLVGEGSGIIVTSNGYIATNAHVVDKAERIDVILSDDTVYEAKLVGQDSDTDLALLKIEADGLAAAELGDSDAVEVGEYVLAIGNPGGKELSSSVTMGIVSAKKRPLSVDNGYLMETIQTDAAINPGNSGGALVNMKGQVVGINSAKYVATGYEGLGFAITINEALPIINDLKANGYVKDRAWFGIEYQFINETVAEYNDVPVGAYVNKVNNLKAGGLKTGDIIIAIDSETILKPQDIKNLVKHKKPGQTVTLDVYRVEDGKNYTVELTLMEQPEVEKPNS